MFQSHITDTPIATHTVVVSGAIRQDTATALANDGKVTSLTTDSSNRLRVAAIPASENQLGFVGGAAVQVLGTLNALSPVFAAAGNYDAGDILSEHATTGHAFEFAGMGRVSAGSGIITKAIITTSVPGWAPTMRLWLFHTAPTTTEVDDNVAFNITVADRTKVLGHIDFEAGADAGDISFIQNVDVRLSYKCAAAATTLYGILQVTEAATNETADMTATVELHALQD